MIFLFIFFAHVQPKPLIPGYPSASAVRYQDQQVEKHCIGRELHSSCLNSEHEEDCVALRNTVLPTLASLSNMQFGRFVYHEESHKKKKIHS